MKVSHDENILNPERSIILNKTYLWWIYGGYISNQDRKVELRMKFICTCYLSKLGGIRMMIAFFLNVVFFHLEQITGQINELMRLPLPCHSLLMIDL